mmetsp:Transcript_1371/g.2395  ORF Transcript_1371/g.2395 Transcript_1371/m.2395 type:complete len:95 (+) Transcript_1371:158-442(+)|eukprot:CAMPEP_0178748688 /NCGR_PEP_ID=MMETSP0744-20121128/9012_1 /TAXON_ID=913974 /ORGANISM="Nitzschia punctata, Strain CCMP561" /LENGTH=94 /DNA_ID=CAMNT_0020402055 /DNA_START=100 /DNA_END=384 /DNA_ORIENTATION=+
MASRVSGNKLVSLAVAGTITVVGVSCIYIPFFADRDKMRGLHEESAPPTSAMLAQEIKKLQREGILKGEEDQDDGTAAQAERPRAPGSMWKQFK